VWVDSGYIAKGSSADETVDFTAPAGYKELCVVIDAREECGFKSVTTDFGLNYITDKYVQEQANKSSITTERECISGSPSALSMVNLNLQAGVEDVANPEIAMSGIVRVCATQSPGSGVSGARWQDVGYCGDSKMRCWLDSDSVKNNLERVATVEGSSIAVLDKNRGLIENEKLSLEEVRKILSSVSERVKGLSASELENPKSGKVVDIVGELDKITGDDGEGGAGTNADRAEALALKASVYRKIVIFKKENGADVVKPEPVASGVGECVDDGECGVGFCDVNGKCVMCKEDKDCGSENAYCDSGECRVRVVEKVEEKVNWVDLVEEGYGENKNGGQFLRLSENGSLNSVKGEYNEGGECHAERSEASP